MERVSLSIGNLRGLSHSLPSPWLLVRPLLRREAIYSSRIEGTITSPEQLALYEANPSAVIDAPTVREVHNYVTALTYGLQRLESLPVCLRLIRELHLELMDRVRGGDRHPGEFRSVQNWIGRRGARIEDAGYVPPPPDRMRESLDQFDKYVGFVDESPLPKLIDLPLIHYQFEAIHPFADGNGRIGRLLVTLLMAQWGLLPIPFLNLSAYLERHRQDYVRHLLAVSQEGAWDPWLKFFLRGMYEESEDAANRIQQLIDLRESYRERLQTNRSPANLLRLVDGAVRSPRVDRRHCCQTPGRYLAKREGERGQAGRYGHPRRDRLSRSFATFHSARNIRHNRIVSVHVRNGRVNAITPYAR